MNDVVITGVFSIIGALAGGLFPTLLMLIDKKNKNILNKSREMSEQIIAYWRLEKQYSKYISEIENKKEKTVLEDFRICVF